MKNNDKTFNEVQEIKKQNNHSEIKPKRFMILRKNTIGKYMKIFSYMVLLVGIAIVFNSCLGGYVASEPSYVGYDGYNRPQRPSETHIWIDGDWDWNNQTHIYVQRAGYWERPRQGQTYVAGSWQTTARGKSWTKGHWQRDARQGNNSQYNNRQRNLRQRDNRDRDDQQRDNR